MTNRIKALRKAKGLSQTELADKTGISNQAVSFYENGKRQPKIETWQKLADYFNVSTSYLMGIDNHKPKNRLKELRDKAGLSQDKLVSSFNNYLAKNNIKGITTATYSRWENSNNSPTKEMWKYLADYFNVSVPYIRGEIDTNKIQKILQTILFFNCSDYALDLLKTDEFANCDREDKKHMVISYLMLLIFQELHIDPYDQFLLIVKKVANLLELKGNERDDFIKQGMNTADKSNQKHDIKAANELLNIYDQL